jgi:hypothetical protein
VRCEPKENSNKSKQYIQYSQYKRNDNDNPNIMIQLSSFAIPLLSTLKIFHLGLALSLLLLVPIWFWLTNWPGNKKTIDAIRASPFHPVYVPEKLDTIVIGSGSGGSACGNLLAQSGQRVLILEQHPDRTGGCTHSFRENGCEWDTGLHYTSKNMSDKTSRPGGIMDFMTQGKQKWRRLDDPYDEVVFPPDERVSSGLPNMNSYPFSSGTERTVDAILANIDPTNEELKKRYVYVFVNDDTSMH